MKYRLLLFDIDGTLIWSGYAGGRALERTFNKLYGIRNCMKGVRPDGMTDPQIVREIFIKNVKKEPDEKEIERVFEKYLENLEKTVWNQDYRVMEGIPELLKELKNRKKFLLGLATGNIYQGARLKLMPSGLWDYFEFGGFASDSAIREKILIVARKRAEEIIKDTDEIERIFVIGDTHLDIIAAKKAGFNSIAVATGNFSLSELKKYSPDYVFESFKDYKRIIKILEAS